MFVRPGAAAAPRFKASWTAARPVLAVCGTGAAQRLTVAVGFSSAVCCARSCNCAGGCARGVPSVALSDVQSPQRHRRAVLPGAVDGEQNTDGRGSARTSGAIFTVETVTSHCAVIRHRLSVSVRSTLPYSLKVTW